MAVTTYYLDPSHSGGAKLGTQADPFEALSELIATLNATEYTDDVVINCVASITDDILAGLTLYTIKPTGTTVVPKMTWRVTDSAGNQVDDTGPRFSSQIDLLATSVAADFEEVIPGPSGWVVRTVEASQNIWRLKAASEGLIGSKAPDVCFMRTSTDGADPYADYYAANAPRTLHSDSGQPGIQRAWSDAGGWRGDETDALGAKWVPYADQQFSRNDAAGERLAIYAEGNPATVANGGSGYFQEIKVSIYPALRFSNIQHLVFEGKVRTLFGRAGLELVTNNLVSPMILEIDGLDRDFVHFEMVHTGVAANWGNGVADVYGYIRNFGGKGCFVVAGASNGISGGDLEIGHIVGERIGGGPVKGSGTVKAEGSLTSVSNKLIVHHVTGRNSAIDNNGFEQGGCCLYYEAGADADVDVYDIDGSNIPSLIQDNNGQAKTLRVQNFETDGTVPRLYVGTKTGVTKNLQISHGRFVCPQSGYWRNVRKQADNRGEAVIQFNDAVTITGGTRTLKAAEFVGDDSGTPNQYLIGGDNYDKLTMDSTVIVSGFTAHCIDATNSTADQTPTAAVTTTANTAVNSDGYPTAAAAGNALRWAGLNGRRDKDGKPSAAPEPNSREYTPPGGGGVTQVI